MKPIEATQILAQIRAFQSDALARGPDPSPAPVHNGRFATILKGAVDGVNATEQQAVRLAAAFERGEPGIELAEVMVAMQKASLGLRTVSEVRNHLVRAYQDVMNMPI